MADFADDVWDLLNDLREAGWVDLCWVPVGFDNAVLRVPGIIIQPGGPLGFAEEQRLVGQDEVVAYLMKISVVDGIIHAD